MLRKQVSFIQQGWTHITIKIFQMPFNHFKGPDGGVCTNSFEAFWNQMKHSKTITFFTWSTLLVHFTFWYRFAQGEGDWGPTGTPAPHALHTLFPLSIPEAPATSWVEKGSRAPCCSCPLSCDSEQPPGIQAGQRWGRQSRGMGEEGVAELMSRLGMNSLLEWRIERYRSCGHRIDSSESWEQFEVLPH